MTATNNKDRLVWFGGKREAIQDLYFREALDPTRWQEGDASDWHSCWYTGMPEPAVFEQLDADKTINHIPGNNSLTVKSNLHATLDRAWRRLVAQEGPSSERAHRLRFFPAIYSMPRDYHALQAAAQAEPGRRWILKPKNGARGKDIRLVGDVATAPTGRRWMVQEYLDNPHTMLSRKYVLRLYVLVTSVEPLRVYLFHEGSAKLASAAYDPDNIDNLYAHLTNPDVNATNQANTSPVVFVNLAQYREWLREQGHDDAVLFSRLRELVALTVISARESMRERLNAVSADTSGCYELLGLDCLVDAELNPWLLECNLSPSLETCAAPEDGGETEARNKREMIEDLVRLLGLNEEAPERSHQSPADRVIDTAERERERAGGWTRIFPAEDAEAYLPYLPMPRLADMVLAEHAAGGALARPTLRPRATTEIISDNQLSLYEANSGTLYTPNPSAAWIWLKATDGADPDSIADELAAARGRSGAADWATRNEVWEVLADWATSGLLVQATGQPAAAPETPASPAAARPTRQRLRVDGVAVDVDLPDGGLSERVNEALAPLAATQDADADSPWHLHAMIMTGGYALAREEGLVTTGLPLASVVPQLVHQLRVALARRRGGTILPGTLVPTNQRGEAVWFLPAQGNGDQTGAIRLAAHWGRGHAGSLILAEDGSARSAGLPVASSVAAPSMTPRFTHTWGKGQEGYLIPAQGDAIGWHHNIVGVVVSDTATDSATPQSLSVHDVLPHLLAGVTTASGDALDAGRLSRLAEWLEQRPLWALDPGREDAAEALIERLAATPETAGAPAS